TTMIKVPITEPQQEIWLARKMGGDNANKSYTLSHTAILNGQLDVLAMKRAVRALVIKHDSLRAVFDEEGQTIIINETASIQLDYKDISNHTTTEKATYLKDFETMNKDLPFDLETGPLA